MSNIFIVPPGHEIITPIDHILDFPRIIEKAGRTCYKSEGKITDESADNFVKMLIKSGHHSVLEHCSITVKIICDRATSHQLVRHRIAAYSQESQRYCNYQKKLSIIAPTPIDAGLLSIVYESVEKSYYTYLDLLIGGCRPEIARAVLPNCTKTEVVTTFNLRQWRHVFQERALNKKAQGQIRQIMSGILEDFTNLLPAFFEDLK